MTRLLVGTIPGPVLPLQGSTDLNQLKIAALQVRFDYLCKLYDLKCSEAAHLRRQLIELDGLCAGLAEDLEAAYALQDQGAAALAAQAAQEVDDERHR